MAQEPAITTYGDRSAQAPAQLGLFSFLVGKWRGNGKVSLPAGGSARFEMTWIGRYVLDGRAIADEFHSLSPDGQPHLGISLRYFDLDQHSWIIEYLNVSNSFIRRQVNHASGSVRTDGDTVIVISEDGPRRIREYYRVQVRTILLIELTPPVTPVNIGIRYQWKFLCSGVIKPRRGRWRRKDPR